MSRAATTPTIIGSISFSVETFANSSLTKYQMLLIVIADIISIRIYFFSILIFGKYALITGSIIAGINSEPIVYQISITDGIR